MRGLPDDHGNGFMRSGDQIDDVWAAASKAAVKDYLDKGDPNASLISYKQKVESGEVDPEPDQFYVNLAGKSAKFVLGADGTARTIPYRKWDINYDTRGSGEIEKWTVTVQDGTKYVFGGTGAQEFSYDESSEMMNGRWTSTWHLKRIESAQGDETITFDYGSSEELQYEIPEYAEAQVFVGRTLTDPVNRTPRSRWVDTRALERITTDREEVIFNSTRRTEGRPRFEAGGDEARGGDPARLESFQVQTAGGEPTRHVHFEYSNPTHAGRHFLQEVREDGGNGGETGGSHTFDYYDGKDGETTLPGRLSNEVDHWGYYNGRPNDEGDRIPEVSYEYEGEIAHYDGADRRPSAPHMKAGVLTEITYPTGGRTEFVWEPHDYTFIGRQQEVGYTEFSNKKSVSSPEPGLTRTTSFTVEDPEGEPRVVSVEMGFTLDDGNGVCPGYCVEGQVLDTKGDSVHSHRPGRSETGQITYSHNVELAPGTYTLKAINREGGSPKNTVNEISANWKERTEVSKKQAGGLRIRSIKTYDGTGSDPEVSQYRYPAEDASSILNPSRSAGVLVREPNYYWVEDFSGNGRAVNVSTKTVAGLGATQGSPIGYERVVVLHGADTTEGWTDHRFRTATDPDAGGDVQSGLPEEKRLPNARVTNYDYKRGWKESERVYSGEGNLVRKTKRRVRFSYQGEPDSPTTRQTKALAVDAGRKDTPFYFKSFKVVSAWKHQTYKKTTIYDRDDGRSTWTKTWWHYDNLDHLQVTRERQKTSDGHTRTTRYKYAHEEEADHENVGYTDMLNHHMLSQKYRTTVTDGDGRVLKRRWQTWQEADVDEDGTAEWLPYQQWEWTGPQ